MAVPTGRVVVSGTGVDLVLERTFDAPVTEIWAAITDPELTARWIGPWEREAGGGRLQMLFEEGCPWSSFVIATCRPPEHLALTMLEESGGWEVELTVARVSDVTTLTFVHHLPDAEGIGDLGPGWEYYLDRLVAARTGAPAPDFDDYHPAQQEYFRSQV